MYLVIIFTYVKARKKFKDEFTLIRGMEVICVYYAASNKTNKVTCVCFETHISKHGKLFYLMRNGYLSFVAIVITH